MALSDSLPQSLIDALNAKGDDYHPRTAHLDENGHPLFINHLILEDSPYLLQHAHNPVNWYSWGEEAFSEAQKQDKPIFLSIGYATCHWCHVMEEESFESKDVADLLNEYFISIKVDREQHPDIDATYMTAVTLLSGHGGWPMSSFLCPDGRPFFGGTYYPKDSFIDLLGQIKKFWHEQKQTLIKQAGQLADAVKRSTSDQQHVAEFEQNLLPYAVSQILNSYDSRFGGFSAAPKFPHEPLLLLILQILQREPNPQLEMALEHTLAAMAQGGIYDQVGGGFHRYSVDQYWLVPHFEKMLYNQAYLVRVYLNAYCQSGNPLHDRIVRQTLDYVLREMTDARGMFFSATDADSEGREGAFFVWRIDEIRHLLSAEDAQFLIDLYGMTPEGNFEENNILFLPRPLNEVSEQLHKPAEQLFHRLDHLLETLRTYRQQRIPPLTDDKILIAWNGMMITALAEAGHHLQEKSYLDAAERAANALWQFQRQNDGQMWRVNLHGKTSVPARQDDYVHMAEAFLTLYDVTEKSAYLKQAMQLVNEMLNQFLDRDTGAFFMGNEPLLFTQPKDSYDGALPSGNAVALRVLSRLSQRTGQNEYQEHARNVLHSYAAHMNQQPIGYAYMLAQVDELNHGEIGDIRYAADGAIKISGYLEPISFSQFRGVIQFSNRDEGWTFNKEPGVSLINSQSWTLKERSPWNPQENCIEMQLALNDPTNFRPANVQVNVQICNENSCLPEENVALSLYFRS